MSAPINTVWLVIGITGGFVVRTGYAISIDVAGTMADAYLAETDVPVEFVYVIPLGADKHGGKK